MDAGLIFLIVLIVLFLIGFIYLFVLAMSNLTEQANIADELSGKEDMFKRPTGEPIWYGKLPDKVDDYVEPRYVYENLEESTEFLPENGRIIGYRISPELVIHSTVRYVVNPPILSRYIERLGGKMLNETEVSLLKRNWNEISKLRVKSGDEPLAKSVICLWFDMMGHPYAMNFEDGYYRDNFCNRNFSCALVLKR